MLFEIPKFIENDSIELSIVGVCKKKSKFENTKSSEVAKNLKIVKTLQNFLIKFMSQMEFPKKH